MINRTHRFHGRGSLRFVYQRGKTIRGAYGSLKYIHNSRRQTYRMAVVVSRKVSKSAVVRNRIRRRIYEAVRLRETEIVGPYDIVFTVFSEQLATMLWPEITERVYGKLEEADILPSKPSVKLPSHDIVEHKEP
ncbi:MAG TPA: ribonuclease P protein component [Candidatus Saccharimonadales bacterium]|nr:ribonuclease P protein component [Candidatus Saccharimonadales bacterium]